MSPTGIICRKWGLGGVVGEGLFGWTLSTVVLTGSFHLLLHRGFEVATTLYTVAASHSRGKRHTS